MKITANEEYGLRVILQLYKITRLKLENNMDECQIATSPEHNLATLNEIAAGEHISADYAAQILLKLRRGNIVESVRGKKGGYRLSRAATNISLFEIMQALSDEAFAEDFCQNHSGNQKTCVHTSECSIRPVWSTISSMVNDYFKSIRLSDLLANEQGVTTMLETRIHSYQ
jgi:Rrf2 family iron-sulfur cluster assembly transcriptional regulator